jgi:hypothetical protein
MNRRTGKRLVQQRLAALLSYIHERRPGIDPIVAIQIAFQCDMDCYYQHGKPISCAVWKKTATGVEPHYPRKPKDWRYLNHVTMATQKRVTDVRLSDPIFVEVKEDASPYKKTFTSGGQ